MAEPYLAEVRLFPFSFAPKGWAQCNGQLLPINQNQALFSLLNTTFGGDGRVNFALPNLQGRVPIHFGGGHDFGEAGGATTHTLTTAELPAHTHVVSASSGALNQVDPAGRLWGASSSVNLYSSQQPNGTMLATGVATAGGGQAHSNLQPYLTLNFCIALQGIFPSQN